MPVAHDAAMLLRRFSPLFMMPLCLIFDATLMPLADAMMIFFCR